LANLYQFEWVEKPIKMTVIANPQGEAISPFRRNNKIATSLRSSQRHPKRVFQLSQFRKQPNRFTGLLLILDPGYISCLCPLLILSLFTDTIFRPLKKPSTVLITQILKAITAITSTSLNLCNLLFNHRNQRLLSFFNNLNFRTEQAG
jgi:hypothetical protein